MIFGIFIISVLVLEVILQIDEVTERRRKAAEPAHDTAPGDLRMLAGAIDKEGRGATVPEVPQPVAAAEERSPATQEK